MCNFNGITERSFSTQLLIKETEDKEQKTIPVEVFNIHIWETTANPLKLLWSSSSDITKSKATVWDLEDGLSGNDCSTTHHIYSNTAQKHIPETLNHKGKFSTCWNMKGKEAALNRHVRFCLRGRKIFLTIKLCNSSKHKSLLGIWSWQLLFLGCFVWVLVFFLFCGVFFPPQKD